MALSDSAVAAFRRSVYEFYGANRRSFPWREDITPYRIVVSEIMLQQTGVERVMGKFGPFVDRFPDFGTLAAAPLRDVMEAWQGLGYNRRAMSLKKLGGAVMDQYSGELPRDEASLTALPGIGKATAGSVIAFAFNIPAVFIETNIRRVFIHHFYGDRDGVSDRQIVPLVDRTLDRMNPRDWYYALMDYGSLLGRAVVNPNRKSIHYVRQSAFEGSDRKVRGEIVRLLLKHARITLDDMAAATGESRDRLSAICEAMVRDGLICREGDSYGMS